MVSGCHLSQEEKEYLQRAFTQFAQTPLECLNLKFGGDAARVSLGHLTKIQHFFQTASVEDVARYIYGAAAYGHKSGPKELIGEAEGVLLSYIAKQNPKRSHAEIAVTLADEMGGQFPVVSANTIARNLKKQRLSSQKLTHLSIHLDDEQRWATLEAVKHNSVDQLNNFDESSGAAKKFTAKHAYGKKGVTPVVYDWSIVDENGVVHSAIANYSPFGWKVWRIFLANLNHLSVERFLVDDLAACLSDDDVVLYDGATTHTCATTVALLDNITGGKYVQVAAYSHDLSPVERGFANVWGYVRHHWNREKQTATDILNEAFWMFSVQGPWGHHGE